jgi:DNA-binding transcriptional LysR family regulator
MQDPSARATGRLSLRALRYFVAAAETGSVTGGAQQVRVSQPSISAAIARLEADLKVQLFVRHHAKGLSLTLSGDRLLVQARSLLAHARELEQFAGTMGDAQRGEVSAGCFITLAPFLLPGLLSDFAESYPEISVNMEEGNQAEVLEQLRSGRCEVALTYAYGLSDEFEAEVLAELPPRIILAHDHPLARRRQISLKELAGAPMILLDLPHTRDYFLSLFRSVKIEPRVARRTRSYEMVRGLAARGLGFGILNAIPRLPWTYDGKKIVAVPIAEEMPNILVVSLRLKRAAARPAVSLFAQFARQHFAEVWPKLTQSAPRRRSSGKRASLTASTRAADRRR